METPEIKKVKKVKRLTTKDDTLNEIIKQDEPIEKVLTFSSARLSKKSQIILDDEQGKEALFKYEKEVNNELDKLKVNRELQQKLYFQPIKENKKKYILRTEKGEIIERYF